MTTHHQQNPNTIPTTQQHIITTIELTTNPTIIKQQLHQHTSQHNITTTQHKTPLLTNNYVQSTSTQLFTPTHPQNNPKKT